MVPQAQCKPMVDRIVTFKLSCYETLSVIGDRHCRLSEVKVEEGMEPQHIDGVVALGCMAKQGAK